MKHYYETDGSRVETLVSADRRELKDLVERLFKDAGIPASHEPSYRLTVTDADKYNASLDDDDDY